jgi:hypothetical protein
MYADKTSKNKTNENAKHSSHQVNNGGASVQLADMRIKSRVEQLHQATADNNSTKTETVTQLQTIQLVKWDKKDPDERLLPSEQIAYAKHIGLIHSHVSHGSNFVPSMRNLDASRQQQLAMSASQTAARVAKAAKKVKKK